MGVRLSNEEDDELFGDFFKEKAEERSFSFRGKSRAISTLEKSLKNIGQDQAIGKVVAISAAAINSPQKPLRTMLFLSPTGADKTELRLQLPDNLYIDPLNVIRLDMA